MVLQAWFGHRQISPHYSAPMDLSTLKNETIIFFQNITNPPSDMPPHSRTDNSSLHWRIRHVNPYPTAFPYGNGMVLHFYQQQESRMTKTVHKVINRGLKTYV